MDAVHRTEDRFHHLQYEPSESDRSQGYHWGPVSGKGHQTVAGAGASAIKHNAGGYEDPRFRPDQTVDHSETQKPVTQKQNGIGAGPRVQETTEELEVLCGPLLNYRRMSGEHTNSPIWHGSVLLVISPGQIPGQLRLHYETGQRPEQLFEPEKLVEDPQKAFWRFAIELPFQDQESTWSYSVPRMRSTSGVKNVDNPKRFSVPSKHQSMRIMFHSCNGFSVGTDEDAWSGPALWNDVNRMHAQQPFHVMIGGGDQIYNDGVRVDGPLRPWTDMANPKKRRDFPFNEELRAKCDSYYFNNYTKWYNTFPFVEANGQIPQLNIWDDHDIIDGFGSYTDNFMRSSVFRGIGGIAHKYYMLFQHHLPPPKSTFTTDAPQTTHVGNGGTPMDSIQLKGTFVMTPNSEDPSFIMGTRPGPYVEERSRSIYCQLGARIAFIGIDARTERTRHQINYPETYDLIFKHASHQLSASNGALKHLILLLGVPIAYPRLQWLENILQSPIIGPIRFLNKRFGIAGGFFNHFDGNVDILDDLDDHYTAHQHKKERKDLVLRLQALAKQYGIRVSILGGDVHLAALGRFYSNPKLGIPAERDWRYMPNIISSAITNKPPPMAVANLLAKRNKIHHLDPDTDETLLNLFDKNPGAGIAGVRAKTSDSNHATMPSRNYAIIRESHDHATSQTDRHVNGNAANAETHRFQTPTNPREPLHAGEEHAGTKHPAADGVTPTGLSGVDGLDVTIRIEISPSDREGKTEGYGFSVPALDAKAYSAQGTKW